VYDSFGAVTVLNASWTVLGGSASAWIYLHQGGRVDGVSGLVHFRNRDYSVTLGRWATMDPIRYAAGDLDLYRFVSNNPLILTDAAGLEEESPKGPHGYDIEWFTSLNSPSEWMWGFPTKGYRVAATYFYANVVCKGRKPDIAGVMKYGHVIVYQKARTSTADHGMTLIIELDIIVTKKRRNPNELAAALGAIGAVRGDPRGAAAGILIGLVLSLSEPDYVASYVAVWTVTCDCNNKKAMKLESTDKAVQGYKYVSAVHWEDNQTYAADQALTPGSDVPNRDRW
jgi:RHS repeat-associated protein